MPSVLHILPHPGGGGERYLDLLQTMPGFNQERAYLCMSRSPLRAAPSIARRRPRLAHQALGYDLLHLHGDMTAMIALPLLQRTPCVLTTHGLSFLRRAQGVPLHLAHRRWTRVARAVGRIACSSWAEREELLALGRIEEERLVVLPNGIELPAPAVERNRSAIRTELGIQDGEVVGVYLGLLDRYKDPLTATRAARLAREQGAPFTLLVAGDGPLQAAVQAHAGPAVRVLGFRSDPQRLLEAADMFVMPSRREGSSYSLLEAMGHGLAVVASDGAGIPELLGETAIVAPVGDAEVFAKSIVDLASNEALRRHLGDEARARVRDHFGVERFRAAVRALYEAELAGRDESFQRRSARNG